MANIIYYEMTVLAPSPADINEIEARLKEPSAELVSWVASRFPKEEVTKASVSSLVGFEPARNIFCVDPSVNKARVFKCSFKRWTGIVDSHVIEVSAKFPSSAFLLEDRDCQDDYCRKRVIIAGRLVKQTDDGHSRAQCIDWATLDIFAPFVSEYSLGLPFGSLWEDWLDDMEAELERLKVEEERWWLSCKLREVDGVRETFPEVLNLTFDDVLPETPPRPSAPRHNITRSLIDGVWRTLCHVCKQPVVSASLSSSYHWTHRPELSSIAPTAFEITPCAIGTAPEREGRRTPHREHWRRNPERMVVCEKCWNRFLLIASVHRCSGEA